MAITIYRGFGKRGQGMGSGDAGGMWWSTDSYAAGQYGPRMVKAELTGKVKTIDASKLEGLIFASISQQEETLTRLCGKAKALVIKGWHNSADGDERTVFIPAGIDAYTECENPWNY